MKKTICFDLDNIICITKGQNYKLSKPIKKNINFINYLYQNNFYIKIFTARYMGRNNDNAKKAREMGHKMTLNQLKKWNVNYHKLIMGKPSYDIYIDDKNLEFKKSWVKILKKKLKFK